MGRVDEWAVQPSNDALAWHPYVPEQSFSSQMIDFYKTSNSELDNVYLELSYCDYKLF